MHITAALRIPHHSEPASSCDTKHRRTGSSTKYPFIVDIQLLKGIDGDEDVSNIYVDQVLAVPLHQLSNNHTLIMREARQRLSQEVM